MIWGSKLNSSLDTQIAVTAIVTGEPVIREIIKFLVNATEASFIWWTQETDQLYQPAQVCSKAGSVDIARS